MDSDTPRFEPWLCTYFLKLGYFLKFSKTQSSYFIDFINGINDNIYLISFCRKQ